MAPRILPPQDYLRECFIYDPATGTLIWHVRPGHHFKTMHEHSRWNTRYSGLPAGVIGPEGYRMLHINGELHGAHRVIWKLVNDDEPPIVDHENRVKSDNWIDNLRSATKSQNGANSKVQINNKTGLKGVEQMTAGSFRAKISRNGKLIQLGSHSTAEEAHAAYCKAAEELHGEFWSAG